MFMIGRRGEGVTIPAIPDAGADSHPSDSRPSLAGAVPQYTARPDLPQAPVHPEPGPLPAGAGHEREERPANI